MVLSGSGLCRFSTKRMHNNTAKHTKSSAWVLIEPELAEDAPGQILAQNGSMGHIDLARPHRSETEMRVVCVSSYFTYRFVFNHNLTLFINYVFQKHSLNQIIYSKTLTKITTLSKTTLNGKWCIFNHTVEKMCDCNNSLK